MKLTAVGILLLFLAIGFAGNWIPNPIGNNISLEGIDDPYEPICEFPDDDMPDETYKTNLSYMEETNLYYREYSYVWIGENIDTERIRVFIRNNTLHHVEFFVYNQWIEMKEYKTEGNHVLVKFMDNSHTPYTSHSEHFKRTIESMIPIFIPALIGILLVIVDYKLIRFRTKMRFLSTS